MQKDRFSHQAFTIDDNEYRRLLVPQRFKSITQLLFLAILFVISFKALKYGSLLIYAALLVYTLHYTLHIAHECWHGIFFESKTANQIWGQLLSGILALPYEFAKKIHFNHHRHLNCKEDPGYQYTDPNLSRKDILKKLIGTLVLANHIKNLTLIFNMITKKAIKQRNNSGLSFKGFLIPLAIHLIFMGFIIFYFNIVSFLIFEYCVLVLLPLVDALRTLIDHRRGIGIDSTGFTRNFRISFLDKILTKPYFDWHLIHHLYPQIPQSRLHEVELLILSKYADQYYNSQALNSLQGLLESLKHR